MAGGGVPRTRGAEPVTGGAVSSGAFALGRRALFGKGGGAASAGGALGGAQPVFVVNWPGGMVGGDDFFSRKLSGGAAAGASGGGLSAAEKASLRFGPGGLTGAIGAGGVLGGAAIAGSFALAVKALVDATEGTQAALAAQEARLSAARNRGNPKRIADRAMREQDVINRRNRTAGVRSTLDAAFAAGDLGGSAGDVKARVMEAFARGATAEDINAEIGGFGIEVSRNKRGRVRFRQRSDVTKRLAQLTEFDKQLQANPEAAQKLYDEGKLDDVIAETEGLKRLRGRASSLVGKLNKVDVSKIELNVTVQAGSGADAGQQAVQAVESQKASLEKMLTDLTVKAEANQ